MPCGRHAWLFKGALHLALVGATLGLTALCASYLGSQALVMACAIGVLWFVALRDSHWSMRVPPLVAGIAFGAAVVAMAGFLALGLGSVSVSRFNPDVRKMLVVAVGVFAAAMTVEELVTMFESRRRVLLVGAGKGGAELLSDLEQHPEVPFECVGVVEDDRGAAQAPGGIAQLPGIVAESQPDVVVLGDEPIRGRAIGSLLDLSPARFRVIGLDQFYEYAFGRVPVRRLSPTWFMSIMHVYQKPYSKLTKRIFDLTIASIASLISAPLLLVLAVLVKLTSHGPILFRQLRLGEGGRTFEMLKLRSMVDGAEEGGEAVWASDHDPRGTRVGGFLRATRLDELPQLWNVIRGDMSLVGPRPERPEFLRLLQQEVPYWSSRHLVKPGITGWAQIRVGATSDSEGAAEKLSYDLYYLRHRSVLTDLAILGATTLAVPQAAVAHHRHRRPAEAEPILAESIIPGRDVQPSS